jgi:ABC-2 type transport system ATP-binding protein
LSVLAVESVSKRFSDVQAVDEVSFEVGPGEVFGFLGPNGAGKTTTLRMILGITRPDSGHVLFRGQRDLDRRRIGYLPEERGLYEDARLLDVLVYLATLRGLTRRAARRAAADWLGRMGLSARARSKVSTLSKGNQQKIQFAGAVLHGPELAILDEPFSGLDPLNQELFLDLIRELRTRGTAVLVSAHQLDLVERLCDRFYLISRGRRLLAGTLAELRRAAVAGAGEILEVDVHAPQGPPSPWRWRRDGGSPVEVVWRPLSGERARAEIALPEEENLSPLLADLSARHPVRRVHTRALSLHEIYVRAVGGDREQAEPAGQAAAGTQGSRV